MDGAEVAKKALHLKQLLAGLNCALLAVHRERDRIKTQINALDPTYKLEDYVIGECRNCGEPVCSECSWKCPNCHDCNPFDNDPFD
jgi:hypothetical protein